MQVKNKVIVAALAVLSAAGGVSGESCYWKTDAEGGSGGWADATRWKDGKVPQSGDWAYVHGTATLDTAADLEVFERIDRVYTEKEGDVFRFAVSGDHDIATRLDGHGSSSFDTGGTVRLTVTNAYHYTMVEGMEVCSGTVIFPAVSEANGSFNIGKLTVKSPATVVVGSSGVVNCGLAGDGTVTSPADGGAELRLTRGTAENPLTFSGTVSGKIQLTIYGGYQLLTNPANTNTGDFRFKHGTLGVASIGASGAAGSFGTSTIWAQSGSGVGTLRYLGTGESTTKSVSFNQGLTTEVAFDGGPHGGLDLAGSYGGGQDIQRRIIFCGEGTDAVNQVSGTYSEPSYSGSSHILKRGAGTWRFPAKAAAYRGVFAVEEGTLEFGSLAAAGTACALGYADRLYERKSGATSALASVPYAYLLGDGASAADSETLATFSYIGTDAVDCSTRPIALKGAARLRNASSAAFRYAGVTSAQAGENTLVLDGAGTDNAVADVTNGVGTVKVVKEGTGEWTLGGVGGAVAVGGIRVKSGRLTLKNSDRYSWYRFAITKSYSGENSCKIGHIGFYDAAGNEMVTNYTYYSDGAWWNKGARADLTPPQGSYCFESTGCIGYGSPKKVWGPYAKDDNENFSYGYKLSADYPVVFLVRLAADDPAPVAYDVVTGWYATKAPYSGTISDWTVEGSTNGLDWVLLDSHSGYDTIASNGGNYWMSDGTVWTDDETHAAAAGFGVDADYHLAGTPTALDSLEVGEGGVFEATDPVAVSGIAIDCASATAGSYRGVKFAAAGVIRVRGRFDSGTTVATDFESDSGFANLGDWTVEDESGRVRRYAAVPSPDGRALTFYKLGTVVLVR